MAEKITIRQLGEILVERLLSISNLQAVYIGKTGNLQSAEVRHAPNYDGTIPLAVGKADVISKGEDYLIKLLKTKLSSKIKVDNIKEGSAGNTEAKMLYASLNISYITIEELDDDNLFDNIFELTEL